MLAERLTDQQCLHGEGPVWWDGWGGLRWVDMLARDVLELSQDGNVVRRHLGSLVAAIRPRKTGGMIAALERQFALVDRDATVEALDTIVAKGLRFNDGACDPDGRFYCGTMSYSQQPREGALHRLAPDGSVDVVLDNLTISNGLSWNRDGTKAFFVDTPTFQIDVFDYEFETGLSDRRPFALIPEEAGFPDGLTVDAEDGVWVALYGGGAVRRYDSDGRLSAVIDVPTPKPTACALGGADATTLYITTSREGLQRGHDEGAGCLYFAEVEIAGFHHDLFGASG